MFRVDMEVQITATGQRAWISSLSYEQGEANWAFIKTETGYAFWIECSALTQVSQ